MCRLAAFPPGCSPEQAHELVADFVRGNEDGVGSAYVKDGEFILKKYPYSYKEAVSKKDDLFDHMPYKGWTLAHVRWATHGGNTLPNTHPIVRGDLVGVHNGVFSAAPLLRAAMDGGVKWAGETDTEVALYLLNKWGPAEFYKQMPMGSGVFLRLDRKGQLDCIKTSGEMKFLKLDNGKYIVASAFPFKYKEKFMHNGVYGFTEDGTPRDWKEDEPKKKTERYTTNDCGLARGYMRDGRYFHGTTYPSDSCATEMSNRAESATQSRLPLIVIKDGKVEKQPPKPPSLWDWKNEQEILDYIRAMA